MICSSKLQHGLEMKSRAVVRYPVLAIFLLSCSFFSKKNLEPSKKITTPAYKKKYEFIDKGGKFFVYREAGRSGRGGDYVVKKRVYSQDKKREVLERSIAIATPGRLNSVSIVKPRISQYTVWFDKKKYFSELKLDVNSKSMILRMNSPEKQWQGTRKVPFPKGTGVFCFFSMVVECVAATGFMEKAMERGHGKMKFHIIWDGYPYIREQYEYLPDEIFSSAEFVYEGGKKSGEKKFLLSTGGQTIFYVVKPGGFLTKKFWISQGMSMVEKKSPLKRHE